MAIDIGSIEIRSDSPLAREIAPRLVAALRRELAAAAHRDTDIGVERITLQLPAAAATNGVEQVVARRLAATLFSVEEG